MSVPAVSVCNLSKNYYDSTGTVIEACKDISFDAKSGEVFGLLGTNGAGKTTVLRLLSTVLRPTAGTATVAGHSVVDDPDGVRKSIGFLSSDTGIYGRLTGREMMQYFGRLHDISDNVIERRIDEIATTLEMKDFLDRRCDKLSSGQKQRVSIARTIVHDPSVLIFDEPSVGLDILSAAQIVRFIKESRERGKCVIFSTHIMREAEKLCDRLLILHQGTVQICGATAEIQKQFGTTDLEEVFLQVIGQMQSQN